VDWYSLYFFIIVDRSGYRELSKAAEPHIKQEDEGKFRCKTCQKLFRATSFVEKHIANKHPELVKHLDDVRVSFSRHVNAVAQTCCSFLISTVSFSILTTSSRLRILLQQLEIPVKLHHHKHTESRGPLIMESILELRVIIRILREPILHHMAVVISGILIHFHTVLHRPILHLLCHDVMRVLMLEDA
jgi:hypothetical protein